MVFMYIVTNTTIFFVVVIMNYRYANIIKSNITAYVNNLFTFLKSSY